MIVTVTKMLHIPDGDYDVAIRSVAKAIAGGYDVLISGIPDRDIKSIWAEVNAMLNRESEEKVGTGWNGMKK